MLRDVLKQENLNTSVILNGLERILKNVCVKEAEISGTFSTIKVISLLINKNKVSIGK